MNNVIQIFISEEKEDLCQKLQNNCRKIINLYTDCNYELFDDAKIRHFLKENYEEEILQTYNSLIPFSYKSDFARFCILYQIGGWYFDIGLKLNKRFEVGEDINLVFFRDLNIYAKASWACAGGIIYSKPGNKILSKAIELIVENVKTNYDLLRRTVHFFPLFKSLILMATCFQSAQMLLLILSLSVIVEGKI